MSAFIARLYSPQNSGGTNQQTAIKAEEEEEKEIYLPRTITI